MALKDPEPFHFKSTHSSDDLTTKRQISTYFVLGQQLATEESLKFIHSQEIIVVTRCKSTLLHSITLLVSKGSARYL